MIVSGSFKAAVRVIKAGAYMLLRVGDRVVADLDPSSAQYQEYQDAKRNLLRYLAQLDGTLQLPPGEE